MSNEHKNKLRDINIAIKGRRIVQKTNSGETIAIFNSISLAAIAITGNTNAHGNIVACLNNRRKTAYGFKWEYLN